MRKIVWILCLLLLIASCAKESPNTQNEESKSEATVTFGLNIPRSTSPNTRSVRGSVIIDNITILVFDATDGKDKHTGEFLYSQTDIKPTVVTVNAVITAEFVAQLQISSTPIRVYIFANPPAGAIDTDSFTSKNESEIIESLETGLDLHTSSEILFPMSASLYLEKVTPALSNSGNKIEKMSLLRSVARVDISSITLDFALLEAYIYSTPARGRLVSNNKTSPVTSPTMPSDSAPISPLTALAEENKIENKFYIYENIASTKSKFTTRIVVKGTYAGNDYYYPIDFINKSGDAYIPILRNHQYLFKITNITGTGYLTKEDASVGDAKGISADIISWDDADMNYVVFDDGNYFSANSNELIIRAEMDGFIDYLVKSNTDYSEWEMAWSAEGVNPSDYYNDNEVIGKTFNVTKSKTNDTDSINLKIKVNIDYTENIAEVLHIKINDKLSAKIKVMLENPNWLQIGPHINNFNKTIALRANETFVSAYKIQTGHEGVTWTSEFQNANNAATVVGTVISNGKSGDIHNIHFDVNTTGRERSITYHIYSNAGAKKPAIFKITQKSK